MMRSIRQFTTWLQPERFIRDRRGASAVEFAFVAAPLFFLLMWLVQLGVFFVRWFRVGGHVSARDSTEGCQDGGGIGGVESAPETLHRSHIGATGCLDRTL